MVECRRLYKFWHWSGGGADAFINQGWWWRWCRDFIKSGTGGGGGATESFDSGGAGGATESFDSGGGG